MRSVIYDKKKVKQLKLVTGEEIIAEIVEEDDQDVIVRNMLQINFGEVDDGRRMWTFRYYMCYQDDPERFILLKLNKIVAIANPMSLLVDQYEGALGEMVGQETGQYPEYLDDDFESELAGDSDAKDNVLSFPTIH